MGFYVAFAQRKGMERHILSDANIRINLNSKRSVKVHRNSKLEFLKIESIIV